ncbi:MAG: histidinol phosphate phosphatase domain-containing protein [Elusimicrobiota bacterium]
MKLIDLHTHTFFSDGVLSPAELVYRYKNNGCEALAITDHVDYSNLDFILDSIIKVRPKLEKYYNIKIIMGVELTYIPPGDIENMVKLARKKGAELVIVHGESSAEQVPPGTNMSGVRAGCDILAHPGHLSEEAAKIAEERNVFLELTTRKGHRDTNKEVIQTGKKFGCNFVLNTDAHVPEDILDQQKIKEVLQNCFLEKDYYEKKLIKNSIKIVKKCIEKRAVQEV